MNSYEIFFDFLRQGGGARLGISISRICREGRVFTAKAPLWKIYFELEHEREVSPYGDRLVLAAETGELIFTSTYVFDPIAMKIEEIREKRRPGKIDLSVCRTANDWVNRFWFKVSRPSRWGEDSRIEAYGLFESFGATSLKEAVSKLRSELQGRDFSAAFNDPDERVDVDLVDYRKYKTQAVVIAAVNELTRIWENPEQFE